MKKFLFLILIMNCCGALAVKTIDISFGENADDFQNVLKRVKKRSVLLKAKFKELKKTDSEEFCKRIESYKKMYGDRFGSTKFLEIDIPNTPERYAVEALSLLAQRCKSPKKSLKKVTFKI